MTEKKRGGFLKGIRSEFKKIVWPTKKELTNAFIVVIVSLITVSVTIWVLDTIIRFLIGLAL